MGIQALLVTAYELGSVSPYPIPSSGQECRAVLLGAPSTLPEHVNANIDRSALIPFLPNVRNGGL